MKTTMLHAAFKGRLAATSAVLLASAVMVSAMPRALADSYDKARAVSYARTYANRYNYPTYPVLTEDCTNFVSQALLSGGWTFRTDRNETMQWWYRGRQDAFWYYSQSWSVANTLYNFTLNSNRGYVIGQGVKSNRGAYNSLEPGDLIFCDWFKTVNGKPAFGEDGWIDHVYIVTGKSAKGIYVSAHTSPHLDVLFMDLFDNPELNKGMVDVARFYYVRMRTQY